MLKSIVRAYRLRARFRAYCNFLGCLLVVAALWAFCVVTLGSAPNDLH